MWHKLYIYGLSNVQQLCLEKGAIFAPNHQSYWDLALFIMLSEKIGKRAFVYMDHERLLKYNFWRWCGAIPIKKSQSSVNTAQLAQAYRLCTEPTQLWMFSENQKFQMD